MRRSVIAVFATLVFDVRSAPVPDHRRTRAAVVTAVCAQTLAFCLAGCHKTVAYQPPPPDVARAFSPCVWPNDMKTIPQNLTFADAPAGAAPKGWLGPGWGYSAVTVAADQCHGGQQCATVHFLRSDPSFPGSFLMQNLDVTPYRGQILTYRAFVRVDPARKSVARLLVRIHRKDCTTSFRDDMGDHPIVSGDWAIYEIHAPIAMDAYHMEFGMQLFGQGAAWIGQISMKVGRRKLLSAPVRAAATEPVLNQMLRAAKPRKASFGVATGSFPVKDAAGKTVRFSAWIKTENVHNGYAGLWWRVDGPGEGTNRPTLAFDNSQARIIEGTPDDNNGNVRGATGTTPWTLYEFELPVGKTASNINFGVVFTGTGTAWVDSMKVELDGEPYSNPQFDFDFESPKAKGFYTGCGGNAGCTDYKVGIDDTVSYSGHQSLKMQFVGDGATQK